jgi:hypothetical protein
LSSGSWTDSSTGSELLSNNLNALPAPQHRLSPGTVVEQQLHGNATGGQDRAKVFYHFTSFIRLAQPSPVKESPDRNSTARET